MAGSTTEPRPAPYPADTRAKGWRFELDYEQIEQSGTWSAAMAAALEGLPLARPLLLAMWYAAWKQVPCGSLPSDDRELAGAIGIPFAIFAEYRSVLMRGWWLADDGRIYHATLTARVLEMLDYRRKNADRVAAYKASKREQRAGNALPASEQHASNDTGTGTGTIKENPPLPSVVPPQPVQTPKKRAKPADPQCPAGVESQVWSDWLSLRRTKRAPVTETVLAEAGREAAKAGMTLDAFLRVWCARGSQGLQAEWLKASERGPPGPADAEPAWRREQRERNEAFLGPAAARRAAQKQIDIEDTDATPVRLG